MKENVNEAMTMENSANSNDFTVEEYIQKMINSIIRNEESYKTKKVALHRAPLEEWADISSDLVSFEHTDFSQNLAKVFNVIALYEDQKDEKVNYRAIYRFLSQCMQMGRQDDLESLGPIECSILVDLMHSLMDVLSQHDVYVQANILKWKHMLLEYRDSYCNPDPRLLRMASENERPQKTVITNPDPRLLRKASETVITNPDPRLLRMASETVITNPDPRLLRMASETVITNPDPRLLRMASENGNN
ncbi:hypothetical protein MAR_020641 [Mya arenaria]|uniref:Uncharacterized protein n=1 Tax=Mya arenaria TaxID=6604 RepID=A0ABY7E5I9_MYAAR|nr:hypothetical protein MAR_020641 [Mya arenaria]